MGIDFLKATGNYTMATLSSAEIVSLFSLFVFIKGHDVSLLKVSAVFKS